MQHDFDPREFDWGRLKIGSWLLPVATLIIFLIALISTCRLGEVSGEQVAVLLNKVNGEMEVIIEPGVHIYNGVTSEFYTLDKTRQTLEMTNRINRGDRHGDDSLKIKTLDGSDVNIDIKAEYQMIPEQADLVLKSSGPGKAFMTKWMRDYSRSTCRNSLGELTTEEFYNAQLREQKIQQAKRLINERLKTFGLRLTTLSMSDTPRFYKDYEDAILEKKNADQEVQGEKSKANMAEQEKVKLIVEERNRTNVQIKAFEGEMRKQVINAEGDAERRKREADAYYEKVTVGAQAQFYQMSKQAEAILARKEAEAKGIQELKQAMEGEGGLNMVMLEYAKNLKDLQIEAKPVKVVSDMQRFEHNGAAARK